MTVEFRLPDVGEGVAEGELVRWLVEPGAPVTEDQPVAEVETDKAVVEVPSPVDGTVDELGAEPGEVVPVGDVLITFETDAEEVDADPDPEPEAGEVEPAGEDEPEDQEDGDSGGRVFAPPSVRRLARELGVDLTTVEGSGPSGRITEMDVRVAAEGPDADDEDEPGGARADDTGDDATTAATAGETDGEAASPDTSPGTADSETVPDPNAAGKQMEAPARDGTLAAPATRRLARELGVDLDRVPGEERDGETVVTPEEVRAYAEAQQAAQAVDAEALTETERAGEAATGAGAGDERVADETAAGPVEREPYRGIRRTIGEAMSRSKYTAPHVTHHDRLDATGLVEARSKLKQRAEERGVKLTYLPIVMKAVVAALREHPVLNTSLDQDIEEVVYKQYYNLGVAVATDAGLMVPVVENVDGKGLLQIASEVNELAAKARDRSLSREEMQGGTFTITNFGAVGGEYATPIINYPETAILGLGALEQRPVVEGGSLDSPGEVVARPVLPLSLSIDHRVIDGAEAAAFVNTLTEYLGDPTLLLLE